MMTPAIIVGVLIALGIALLLRAFVHARRRRVFAASRNGLGAGCCLAIGGLGVALALNFYTYQRLTYEQPVAVLHIHALGAQRFRVVVKTPHLPQKTFNLQGDDWQLDARVLKWRGWANLLGLDSVYRLGRLSARYRQLHAARRAPHSVYPLDANDRRGLSVWAAAHWAGRWVPLIDTRYGSAVYMPMADGAVYRVALTQSGLVARAINSKAKHAVQHWAG